MQQPTETSWPSPPLFSSMGQQGQGKADPPRAQPAQNPSMPGRGIQRHREGSGKETKPRCPDSVYLPRAEGDEPGVLAKGALVYLMHKLGQLGVCPTAVINLLQKKVRDFREDYNIPHYSLHIRQCHGLTGRVATNTQT